MTKIRIYTKFSVTLTIFNDVAEYLSIDCVLVVYFHKIFIILQSHFSCFFCRHLFNFLKTFGSSRDVEDTSDFVERFVRDCAKNTGTLTIEVSAQTLKHIIQMFLLLFPNRTCFGVQLVTDMSRINTIAILQNPFANGAFERQLLTSLFRFGKITLLLR